MRNLSNLIMKSEVKSENFFFFIIVDEGWLDWSEWIFCSEECGKGI